MNQLKPILTFTWKFLALYFGLMIFFYLTGLSEAYRNTYASFSDSVYKNLITNAEIYCKPTDNPANEKNLEYAFSKKGELVNFDFINKTQKEAAMKASRSNSGERVGVQAFSWTCNIVRTDLLPFIFLLALVLAYPAGWKRKLKHLGMAVLAFQFYLFLVHYGFLSYQIDSRSAFFPNYELSSIMNTFYKYFLSSFSEINHVVVILIWVLICFRKDDFSRIFKVALPNKKT